MRVVITGGGGFLGRRLAAEILARGILAGPHDERRPVTEVILFDRVPVRHAPDGARVMSGDITDRSGLRRAIAPGTASVFHLAAVVSAEAEADFDLGMRVNVDGTRAVIDACREMETPPRLVFTSSLAAFGLAGGVVDDTTATTPRSSYGTEKVIGEQLVSDATRRGFVDGRTLRLPTVVIRPGRPNMAASSFASAILREPLAGARATCPVACDRALWIGSPRCAVAGLIHAHDLRAERLGERRTVNLPGLTVTIAEMVAALERAGGDAGLIDWVPDPAVARIVESWPARFDTARARSLGFAGDRDMDAIVAAHLADTRAA